MKLKKYLDESKQGEGVITDFGEELELTDSSGKVVRKIERYGYWAHDNSKGKAQVKETSNDVKYLLKKYGDVPVVKVGKKQ